VLAEVSIIEHDAASNQGTESMPKKIEMTREYVAEWIGYDPLSGKFTWLKAPARAIRAGSEAGSMKSVTTTASKRFYRYIVFQGVDTPAARVAWLLHYGEWPSVPVQFIDGDSANLRIDNLKLPRFPTAKSMKDGRRVYKMPLEQQRHYGLKRYYGMTGEQYGSMMAEQKGVCAICQKPETAIFKGTPKVMHVDHCHTTNRIRALLCGSCNGMLGLAKDSPETLRAAADYIEKYAALADNVVALTKKDA